MSNVFLSYARVDYELAKRVVAALEEDGHHVWWDQRLTPARGFDELIEEEIKRADCVVVLWTKSSVRSEWVRNEANYAVDKLVPARFDEVDLPIAFHRFQTADLTGWTGSTRTEEYIRMLSWIDGFGGESAPKRKESVIVDEDEPKIPQPVLVAIFGVVAATALTVIVFKTVGARPDACEAKFPDARSVDSTFEPAIALTSECIDRDFALFKDCESCPQIVVLPAGTFMRGTSSAEGGESNELPVRQVTIKYRFGIGRFEVTWSEWLSCVADGACTEPGNVRDDRSPNLPVHALSWQQAAEYLDWISAKSGETYRLPSESEWEYAAKAGLESQYPGGANLDSICIHANVLDRTVRDSRERNGNIRTVTCRDQIKFRAPVGTYTANDFGLFDMIGNVVEPVQDCYFWSYARATDFGAPYQADGCPQRVIRGAAYDSPLQKLRIGFRDSTVPEAWEPRLGLRVVRDME